MIIKKVKACIKLQITAGSANPSPPIGPALGQQGVNIIEFCKEFNNKTLGFEKGLALPVVITVYGDRSFSFIIKSPSTVLLLKKAAGITLGSAKPNVNSSGKILLTQVYDIVRTKSSDMTGATAEAMSRSIIGTARSMGLEVENDL